MRGRRRQSFGNLHGEVRTIPDISQKQLAQVCGRPRLQLTPLMHLHSTYCFAIPLRGKPLISIIAELMVAHAIRADHCMPRI